VRLAFKLFDSVGVARVNLLRGGSGALEEMRERARDLGIVLDEHLVRDAERARTELDTLSQVISANLTRAALEAAPVIADLSSWLADVAGKAGIAWERLFDAPEEKSLRTLVPPQQSYASAGRRARAACAGCGSMVTGGAHDQLPRGPVPGQHRLWRDGRAGVRAHGRGDRKRSREAQRQLGRGARPLGRCERAQEAGADRRADRVLSGAALAITTRIS
jgi:hypothetical protein